MKLASVSLRSIAPLLFCSIGAPAFADCTTNSYGPTANMFLNSFSPNCVFTLAPSLLMIQSKTGTGSYSFGSPDFYMQTNRTGTGTSMTDSFPAQGTTGLTNGTIIVVFNNDTVTDSISAGTNNVFQGGSTTDVLEPGRSVKYVYDGATPTGTWWKVLNTGNQATFSTTSGNTVGDVVQMATTGVGVADSGYGIGTAGGKLCALNAACTFSALDTFSQFQFTGLQTSGTNQDINDQKGTSGTFAGATWNAQFWELSSGKSGTPNEANGPLLKVSKLEQNGESSCGGNNVANECNAAAEIYDEGTADGNMQINPLWVGAKQASTTCDVAGTHSCNALALHLESRLVGSSPFKASAGQFISEDDSTSIDSAVKGIEIDIRNNFVNGMSGGNCDHTSYSGTGNCNGGVMVVAGGTNALSGPGFHVVGSGSVFNEGLVINQGSVQNYGLIDQSSAATSIEIDGTHSTAAINVASGAGSVQLNNNSLVMGGTGQISGAGSIQFPVSQSTPVIYAGADSNSGFFQSTTGTWKYAASGTNVLQFDPSGLTLLSGKLVTQNGQTTPQLTAAGDTTTGFYQSALGVWKFRSTGSDVIRWNGSGMTIGGYLMVGSLTNLTLGVGELGLSKAGPSATAPGASGAKISIVCGSTAGTAKIVAYAGTSVSPTTVADNIGSGVTGC